jgi:transcriptional regulator with XRE-family HTH domain
MKSFAPEHLFRRVRSLREAAGLTQEEFAEKAGVSYKYYQALEAGRKADVRLSTLVRLSKAFGLELWELFSPGEIVPRLADARSSRPRKPPSHA